MMRYKGYYWTILSPLVRKSLTNRYSEQMARMALDNGKKEYRAILERANDIGEDNPLEAAVYTAYVFIAAWLGSGKLISPAGMGVVMGDVLKKFRPFFATVNINTPKGSKYWYRKMKAYEAWSKDKRERLPSIWEVHFDEELHRDGSYFCLTGCPVRTFCQREGIEEIVEPLRDTDRLIIQMQHGVLLREHGTAKDYAKREYWIVGDKIKNPQ